VIAFDDYEPNYNWTPIAIPKPKEAMMNKAEINEEDFMRAVVAKNTADVERPRDRKRIEMIATRLEDMLKVERNKEGRLAGMVARSLGGPGKEKNESHPEPVNTGIVGQIETLLDKLMKTNDMQAALISKLEDLM